MTNQLLEINLTSSISSGKTNILIQFQDFPSVPVNSNRTFVKKERKILTVKTYFKEEPRQPEKAIMTIKLLSQTKEIIYQLCNRREQFHKALKNREP